MELTNIPNTQTERLNLLKTELQQFRLQKYYCPAINKNILVNDHSIKETANNAKITKESTWMALQLPTIIENAKVLVSKVNPQSNTQKNTMHLNKMFILHSEIPDVGIAKLIIGRTYWGKYIHYSITSIKIYTAHQA